jgi:hypothetical protein
MLTNIEFGYRSIEHAIIHASTDNRRQRLEDGLVFLREEMPKYRILPGSHNEGKSSRYGGTWPQHTFQTTGMGEWKVNVIDPEGLFNRATLTPSPAIGKLASELMIEQEFIKPTETDKVALEHTGAQLFLAANARDMVETVFCNLGAAPPKHIAPFFIEPGHGPDLVFLTPDPLVVEIGRGHKFNTLDGYVDDFKERYPYVAERTTGAVVYYKMTNTGGHLNVFSSKFAATC